MRSPWPYRSARDCWSRGMMASRLAEVDDHVAALEALDRPVHQLADLREVLVVDVVALGLPDFLVEHLFGRLRGDAPEAHRFAIDADLVAEGDFVDLARRLALGPRPQHAHLALRALLGDERLRLVEQNLRRRLLGLRVELGDDRARGVDGHRARLPVDQRDHGLVVVVLSRGRGHGLFQRAEHLLGVDVFLARNLSDDRRIDDHGNPLSPIAPGVLVAATRSRAGRVEYRRNGHYRFCDRPHQRR